MAKKRMNKKGDTKKAFREQRGHEKNAKGSLLLPHVPTKPKLLAFAKICKDSSLLTLFSLGCFMGLRIGSAIRLKWIDVNLRIGKMSINDDKNTKRFKTQYGKDRSLDIPSFYIPVLSLWKEANRGEEYVIPRGNSKKSFKSWVRHFEYLYDEMYKKLGMKEKWVEMKNGGWRYKYQYLLINCFLNNLIWITAPENRGKQDVAISYNFNFRHFLSPFLYVLFFQYLSL